MGLLDKVKGLLKGHEEQVKSGIDTVSDKVEEKVPQHAAKVDAASDKAKDTVDKLAGDDDAPATPATPATPEPAARPAGDAAEPADHTRLSHLTPGRARRAAPDGAAPLRRVPGCRSEPGSARRQSLPVSLSLTLVDAFFDLAGRFVDLALSLEVLVVGEVTDGLLDPALGLIGFTTHERSFLSSAASRRRATTNRRRRPVNPGCSTLPAVAAKLQPRPSTLGPVASVHLTGTGSVTPDHLRDTDGHRGPRVGDQEVGASTTGAGGCPVVEAATATNQRAWSRAPGAAKRPRT